MSKQLTAAFVRNISKPGRYSDGNGLYLRVAPGGSKQWVQRLYVRGVRRDMGLGGAAWMPLKNARERALVNKRLARAGGDPTRRGVGGIPTFAEAFEQLMQHKAAAWGEGSASPGQWRASINTHAMPRLGRLRIDEIDTQHVMAMLLPIWSEKHQTAKRVRQRVSAVMKFAIAQGWRQHDPAGDAISAALPKGGERVKHHKSVPYKLVGGAISKVQDSNAGPVCKLLFEWLVLTATRTAESRGARYDEIDIEAREWRIPAERMKARRPHTVPLSARCLQILQEAKEYDNGSGLIFPSPSAGMYGERTLGKLSTELGLGGTPHGYRSSFADWAAEVTNDPTDVVEACLAHLSGSAVERAYRRTDFRMKRARLMQEWASYVGTESVVFMVRRA